MAIVGDVLYVTDLDHVRRFDRKTGAPKGAVKVEGATFLNDLCAGEDGSVYVSDSGLTTGFAPSGTDAVHVITGDEAKPLVRSPEMGKPNGLLCDGDRVWVVTFGSGELYSVGADGKITDRIKPEKGQLDGLERAPDGQLLFSSWEGKAIYKGPPGGPFSAIVTGIEAPADIGWDATRKRVLIPLFNGHALQFHTL
jgi:sugar lactone lactonase YvrE